MTDANARQENRGRAPQRGSARVFLLRKLRLFRRDRDGVAAIEFAAIALPFFMILFGLVEFGLAFFVNRILDFAALETTRQIRTGQAMQSGMTKDQFMAMVCEKMTTVLCDETRLTVDVQTFDDFASLANVDSLLDEDGNVIPSTSFQIGGASDIVIARLIYKWPMFTSILGTDSGDSGDMYRKLYTTVVFRNEPFPW
ncbi:TadE/TadG family type IV pilus assembly protein [Roseibium aestuarii]|uniref:TadE/TadG family type IV pilus assembly protein n=1 Tax=Roseibium aestuarii TaxID=2600299 RepID=A0ABW4JTN1_9HYPH|nr:TadE/TadG family type IV pilus assembly protein [Roseibium aestuarii]